MQSYRKTASFQCCLLRRVGWYQGCKLLRTARSSGVGSCPTLVFSHRVRNNLTKLSFNLIPYLFFGFLSHVASTRYQETSHANLSWSAWSQPSEDVDFWEVLQRGEANTLLSIVAKSHGHWDIRWPTCWGRRRSMCTTWTSWASCVSTSTDPK